MSTIEGLYDYESAAKPDVPPIANVAPPPTSGLKSLINRILECVEAETRSISADGQFDPQQTNGRKSRLLYELGRVSRDANFAEANQDCVEEFQALRKALAENEAVLKSHVSAVAEVASIVQRAIEREQADGTYSSDRFARREAV